MVSLARISIARPKLTLGIWVAIAVALSVIGFGVSKTLSPTINVVPGTQSSTAQRLANAHFGPSQLVPILLQGPTAQLNREGPALVRALTKRANTRVMSAWDGGAATAELRKSPTAAMIVVSVNRSEANVVKYDQPQIDAAVARYVKSPVKAYVTGQPSIDRAEKTAALANLRRNELIAIGIVFLLLLIGLRAPIASVLVAGVGAISTAAAFGEVALLGHIMSVDPVAVAAGTMTGLALATGFALLILDRFHREEFPDTAHPRDVVAAAITELETTGKAVLVGGTAIVVALALVAIVGPTQLMDSVGAGALTCALFAIGGTVVVMPAALVLLGRRLDAFTFPAPKRLSGAWTWLVDRATPITRYGVFTGFFATLILAAIAVPALALKSGPQSITQLPANSSARIAFEQVNKVMGAGFATPYDLIVVPRNEPVTTPALLEALTKFQSQIARNPAVSSVSGPAAFSSTSAQLKQFEPGLNHSMKISDQSKKDLVKLINGLGEAGAGTVTLSTQLKAAASGAGQLNAGSGTAQSGAGTLHSYLVQAEAGSAQVSAGLKQALSGAISLRNGAAQALSGANQLSSGLGKGAPQVKAGLPAIATLAADSQQALNQVTALQGQAQSASGTLSSALSELESMTTGKSDPRYAALLGEIRTATTTLAGITQGLGSAKTSTGGTAFIAAGVKSQINVLAPQLTEAASGAAQLAAGIKQLRDGNATLANGISQLAGGGGQLHSGLQQLTSGAAQLQAGLAQLTSGTGQLATGLAAAPGGVGQLTTGIGQMRAAVITSRGQIPSTASLKQLESQSPGIFSSGYFVLSAIAGASAVQRADAGFTLNLLKGGTAAQILVVPKFPSGDKRTIALGPTLVQLAQQFAKTNNAELAVGGPMGNLGDLTHVTKSRIWLDVAVLTLAIILVLAIALRAIVMPIVTTAFSLLVAASTFGVMQILFGGSNPPLGGPGHLDPVTIISVFTIAFSITIMFSTLLLMRTREALLAREGTTSAVRTALRDTAAAATGTGLVMIAALIPFVTTSMINVREFGVGVAVAVLLDIVIVRPVLLPAAEAVLGWFGWWPTVHRPRTEIETPAGATRLGSSHLRHRRPRPANH